IERLAAEVVEGKKDAEANRCAATQAAGAWKLFSNGTRKREGATPRLLEKSICRLRHDSRVSSLTGRGANDRDAIMDSQCDTQTIKARAKIGSASGNANSNLLHRKQ